MGDSSRDQNPIAGYGVTNVDKLKAASQKYNIQPDSDLLDLAE